MTENAHYYSCAWSKVYTLHFYFSPMVSGAMYEQLKMNRLW